MPELPAGTVTFLFTDVEGSTRLQRELGERYAEIVREHRRLLREACRATGGREVDAQGDAFFFAFATARAGVAAAVEAQRRLAAHAWPDGGDVRVRMGMHTGEPSLGDEGYLGLDVVRAARICAVAHGGQILVSHTTRALLGELPDGVGEVDLGDHVLKDFDRPERLYRLTVEGLPDRLPARRIESAEPSFEKQAEQLAASIQEQVLRDVEASFAKGPTAGEQVLRNVEASFAKGPPARRSPGLVVPLAIVAGIVLVAAPFGTTSLLAALAAAIAVLGVFYLRRR